MENFFRSILEFFTTIAELIADIFEGLANVISFNFVTFELFSGLATTIPSEILIYSILGFSIGIIYLIVGR